MNKKENTSITLHARNTLVGTTNRRNEFVPAKDDDGKLVYSNNLGVTFRNVDKTYEQPTVLSAAFVRNIQQSFPKIKNVTLDVDYVLIEDSLTHFKATDSKPQAIAVTYKAQAPDIGLDAIGLEI